MASIKLKEDRSLSDYGLPYFVAELNTSHFGNLDVAKEMILEAKSSGCDCVKFQSWTENTLNSKHFYQENPVAKRLFKKFSLSSEELLDLVSYCEKVGIDFASTPYSKEEVDFLVDKANVPFIKVASMDLNNIPFLEYIGSTNKPVVLSTGMGTLQEISEAIIALESSGCERICVLHCVAIYPPSTNLLQLNNILGLRDEFNRYPIGYSDHSEGIEMASASVALGACLIEKHFTLDKSRMGMDNQMAIEPNEMTQLISACKNVYKGLGSVTRKLSEEELEQRLKMRRSLVASRGLKDGHTLTMEDINMKRPATGIPPSRIKDIIGKKLTRNIVEDEMISLEDLTE